MTADVTGDMADGATVLVTVGTDHHPFTRLMEWITGWEPDGAEPAPPRWVVQHGFTPAPRGPGISAAEMLPHHVLTATMRRAAAVVCQGGPGTIMDARGAGKLPIVVPRRADLGEHVDDHQRRFARRLAQAGLIRVAETEDDFRGLVRAALERPERFAVTHDTGDLPKTVGRFEALMDDLVARPRRRALLPLRRRGQA